MKIRKTQNGKVLRFVGDCSYFEMNSYGVVWQEVTRAHWGPDFVERQLLSNSQQEQFHKLAEKAGASRKLTAIKKELRFNFSRVPSECEVSL